MLIRTKLILLMIIMFLNIMVVMGYAVLNVISSKARVEVMLVDRYQKIDLAHDFRTNMHVANKTVYEAIFVDQEERVIQRSIVRLNALKDAIPVMVEELSKSDKKDEVFLEQLQTFIDNGQAYQAQLVQIVALISNRELSEAKALYGSKSFTRAREILFRNLDDLIQILKTDLAHDAEVFDQAVIDTYLFYSILTLLSLLLFSWVIWRSEVTIIRPIKRISELMNQLLLRGEFDTDLSIRSTDEIGYMSTAVSELLRYIDLAIEDANRVVSAIAQADFSQRMNGDYVGALGLLKQGVNESANSVSFMMDELEKVMVALNQGDLQVQMDERVPTAFRNLVESSLMGIRALIVDINHIMNDRYQSDLSARISAPASGEFLMLKTHINQSLVKLQSTLEDLEASKDKAESASRAKSYFIHNMTHELRTPLNAIMGFSQLMMMDQTIGDQTKYQAEHIVVAAKHLLGIINQVLDMAKIESSSFELKCEPVNLRQVIADAHRVMLFEANQKQLAVLCELADTLPEQVMSDAFQLQQIILHLLNNAVKFTEEGQITIRASYSDQVDQTFLFEVLDTGIGITPETMTNLFSIFSQADNTASRTHGGTGLGLASCKALIEKMQGQIFVESEFGVGSRFWFTLPLRQIGAEQEAVTPQLSLEPEIIQQEALSHLSVLLVEDNKINQLIAQKFLQNMGITADIANNGQEGIDLWQKNHYDLILLDVQMPIKDGYETIIEIRQEEEKTEKHQLVIGLSANGLAQDIEKALRLGMDDYLTKPANFELLHQMICKWLTNR